MKRFVLLSLILSLLLTFAAFAEQTVTETETDTDTDAETSFEPESGTEAEYPSGMYIEGPDEPDGGEFIITVTVDAENLRGGSARLLYDVKKADLMSVEYPDDTDFTVRYSIDGDGMVFVFYNDAPVSGAVVLMEVRFRILEGEPGDAVTVKTGSPVLSDGRLEVTPPVSEYACTLTEGVHSETETDAATDAGTDTATDAETDRQTDPVTEKQTETEKESGPETGTAPVTEPRTETGVETVTETETETGTETEPRDDTETETEAETDTKAVTETEKETTTPETEPVNREKGRFSSFISVAAVIAASFALSAGGWLLCEKLKNKKAA